MQPQSIPTNYREVMDVPASTNPTFCKPDGSFRFRLTRFIPKSAQTALALLLMSFCAWTVQAQTAPDLIWLASGHSAAAYAVAFAPDGNTMATGSDDYTVKLWRVSDGALLRSFTGHTGLIRTVAFSPDGSTIASGSGDTTIKLWRASDGALLRTLTGHTASVRSVDISPDGTVLVSGSQDNTVKLWRMSDGALIRTLTGHGNWVVSVNFSPDGSQVASASYDRTIRLWRVSDGAVLRIFSGHTNYVFCVTFSPDGTTLASASGDTTVRLWRLSDGAALSVLQCINSVYGVSFSPDGTTLLTSDGSYNIWQWRVADGTTLQKYMEVSFAPTVIFSPSGAQFGYGRADGKVALANNSLVAGSPNFPPTVSLASPLAGSTFNYGSSVTFSGTASDVEDGNLTANLVWYSNLDGNLGTGGSFSRTLRSGTHTITASVTDLDGKTGSASLQITVLPQSLPTLDVLVGTDKASYTSRQKVTILVSVTDGVNPVSGANVTSVVTSPKGTSSSSSAVTGANGVAVLYYTVNTKQGYGTYTVTGSASKSGYNSATDSTTFAVTR
jgi:WD40 repeat protein